VRGFGGCRVEVGFPLAGRSFLKRGEDISGGRDAFAARGDGISARRDVMRLSGRRISIERNLIPTRGNGIPARRNGGRGQVGAEPEEDFGAEGAAAQDDRRRDE
jgi:hypothetical protein